MLTVSTHPDLGFESTAADEMFPSAFRRELERLGDKVKYVHPTFQVMGGVDNGVDDVMPADVDVMPADVDDVTPADRAPLVGRQSSPNWCGGMVYPPGSKPFQGVSAKWVVPSVHGDTLYDWYSCRSWIGIDGITSFRPVIRVGVLSAIRGWAYPYPYFDSWGLFFFQWSPGPVVTVGGPVVFPGDSVDVTLLVDDVNSHRGLVVLLNRTRNIGTSFAISELDGNGVGGRTAEWIVTRGWFNDQSILGDFGEVIFADCRAYVRGEDGFVEGATGIQWDMVVGNELVADCSLIKPTTIRCQHVAPSP
jgi:hypothetical protein